MNPMKILYDYTRWYPSLERDYKLIRSGRGKDGLPEWPDWCFAPLATAAEIVRQAAEENNIPLLQATADIGNVGAVAAWEMGKAIYRFSDSLLAELSQASIREVPGEVLLEHFPAWGLYVDTAGQNWVPDINGQSLEGWFAFLEWDAKDGHAELRLALDYGDAGMVSVPINIVKGSLADCIANTAAEGTLYIPQGEMMIVPEANQTQLLADVYARFVAALLYLCSDGPDITPAPTRSPRPPFPYRRTQLYQVGFTPALDEPEGQRAGPSPHIRRAHWQLYHVGPGGRATRLVWVRTTLVGF